MIFINFFHQNSITSNFMDSQFNNIVDYLNHKNGKSLYPVPKNTDINNLLHKQSKITFIGNGVQTICFKTEKNYVIKCCVKQSNSILISKEVFIKTIKHLKELKLPILPILDVFYEDENWLVYSQPMCQVITDVNYKFCYELIKFVQQMFTNNLRISDIYYRNFGIYNNRIVLFDYHNIEDFSSSSNFLITNLYSIFTILGQKVGWNVLKNQIHHWNDIVNDQFGDKRFPSVVVGLLTALHCRDSNQISNSMTQLIDFLHQRLIDQLSHIKTIQINDQGLVVLKSGHRMYDLIFSLIENHNIESVLDMYPLDGGIGIKIAQDFPNLHVALGYQINDKDQLTNYISLFTLNNVSLFPISFNNSRINKEEMYDLVLYHQIISDLDLEIINNLIRRQVKKFFIIDLPVNLNEIKHVPSTFDHNRFCIDNKHSLQQSSKNKTKLRLKNHKVLTFRNYLIEHHYQVNHLFFNHHLGLFTYLCVYTGGSSF